MLNFEKRTGIKDDDIEDFIRKASQIEDAVKGLRDGTLDATALKAVEEDLGIESDEVKARKEQERQARLEQQRVQAEQLRLKRKQEEKDRWWAGSELFVANRASEERTAATDDDQVAQSKAARQLQRYTLDYSRCVTTRTTKRAPVPRVETSPPRFLAVPGGTSGCRRTPPRWKRSGVARRKKTA